MTTNEIRHEGPRPPQSNGAAWERAWLVSGAPAAQRDRDRAEKIAERLARRAAREHRAAARAADAAVDHAAQRAEARALRGLARGFETIAALATGVALCEAQIGALELARGCSQIASVAGRLTRSVYRAA